MGLVRGVFVLLSVRGVGLRRGGIRVRLGALHRRRVVVRRVLVARVLERDRRERVVPRAGVARHRVARARAALGRLGPLQRAGRERRRAEVRGGAHPRVRVRRVSAAAVPRRPARVVVRAVLGEVRVRVRVLATDVLCERRLAAEAVLRVFRIRSVWGGTGGGEGATYVLPQPWIWQP